MDESERKLLLDRLDRDSLTLGTSIPDKIVVQNEDVPLRDIVFKVCSDGEISDAYEMDIDGLKRVLRREMNDCIDTIENDDMTYQRGIELVDKVGIIQRSLNVLESPEEGKSIEQQSNLSDAQNTKRWREFVSKVKGE